MAVNGCGGWISAHDAADEEPAFRFVCKTPDCSGPAAAEYGRHSYCLACQIRRGTRRPDGSLVSGRIPTAPRSRSGRDRLSSHGPIEARVMELVAAARRLDSIVQRQAGLRAEFRDAAAEWHRALDGLPTVQPTLDKSSLTRPT